MRGGSDGAGSGLSSREPKGCSVDCGGKSADGSGLVLGVKLKIFWRFSFAGDQKTLLHKRRLWPVALIIM